MAIEQNIQQRKTQPVVACQGLTKVFKDFWMRQRARDVAYQTRMASTQALATCEGSLVNSFARTAP